MNYAYYVRSQVSPEDWQKLQKLAVPLVDNFGQVLPDFVNFEERRKTEIPFLLDQLQEYPEPKVLDACLGSGATTIGLKLAGIDDIVSNEIENYLIEKAQTFAARQGISLNVTNYDWREFDKKFNPSFDAILCLGNSLTYLFKEEDRLKTLTNFRNVLRPGGKLIIDERNYAQILNGNFRHSGKVVYCGIDKVVPRPIYTSPSMVVMEYTHAEKGEKAHLVLYPFKKDEFRSLLVKAGFTNIQTFGDYKSDFTPEETEFITYIAKTG